MMINFTSEQGNNNAKKPSLFPSLLGLVFTVDCCSFHGDPYKYNNTIPPLPAQRNLTPPPTLYPQQPVSTPDNYTIPRYSLSSVQETTNNGSARSKRMDINV
jgi:hypothetical protein